MGDPSSLPKTRDAAAELQLDIIHMIAQAGVPLSSDSSGDREGTPSPSLLALDRDINFIEAVFLLGEECVVMLSGREKIQERRKTWCFRSVYK